MRTGLTLRATTVRSSESMSPPAPNQRNKGVRPLWHLTWCKRGLTPLLNDRERELKKEEGIFFLRYWQEKN